MSQRSHQVQLGIRACNRFSYLVSREKSFGFAHLPPDKDAPILTYCATADLVVYGCISLLQLC